MKKITFLSAQNFIAMALLLSGVATLNACSPSDQPCPEVAVLPSVGPNMCNLRADKIKVSDTVDTCNLLVQGDAHFLGNLRIDGEVCFGSEPINPDGSEAEEGVLVITARQFATMSPDEEFDLVPLDTCGTGVQEDLVVSFPIPSDFDTVSSQSIVIDLHLVGPVSMGTEVLTSFSIVPFVSFTSDGAVLAALSQGASSIVMLTQDQYRTVGSFIVEPSAGHAPGDLVRLAICTAELISDPDNAPRLAAITVHYPKTP